MPSRKKAGRKGGGARTSAPSAQPASTAARSAAGDAATSQAWVWPQDEAALKALTARFQSLLEPVLAGQPGEQHVQAVLEALLGPDGELLVRADRELMGNTLLMTCIDKDLGDLLALRLALGKDAHGLIVMPGADTVRLPSLCVCAFAPRCLAAVLQAEHVDPNATDQGSWTPLHSLACLDLSGSHLDSYFKRRGEPVLTGGARDKAASGVVTQMARSLRDAGARIDATGQAGFPPIIRAISMGHLRVAEGLITAYSESPSQRAQLSYQVLVSALIKKEEIDLGRKDGRVAVAGADGWTVQRVLDRLSLAWQPDGPAWQRRHRPEPTPAPGRHEPLAVAALLDEAVLGSALLTGHWLESQADAIAVRARVRPGTVPLVHLVRQHYAWSLLEMLQMYGADLTEPDAQGRTALCAACEDEEWEEEVVADYMRELLQVLPAEERLEMLQAYHCSVTPLGHAVACGQMRKARVLLEACQAAGLEISGQLKRWNTASMQRQPVCAAVAAGRRGMLQLLLRHGLDLGSRVCRDHCYVDGELPPIYSWDATEGNEWVTLLMTAAAASNPDMVKLLLAAGVDPREAPAGNVTFTDAVTVVLRSLQLERNPTQERPDAEFATVAELWLRQWDAEALGAGFPQPADSVPGSDAVDGWVREWGGKDPGARFACLLWLLWAGAALTRGQLGELLVLLDSQHSACQVADALENFLYKRLKMCSCCGLLGRWRRCACKRAWYCGRACQKQHWQAAHERECPLARSPEMK